MHICVSRRAIVRRDPAPGVIPRKQEITKAGEIKSRQLPEPQPGLCMLFTVRFAEAWAIADRRSCRVHILWRAARCDGPN
jgi:hypothetical protein